MSKKVKQYTQRDQTVALDIALTLISEGLLFADELEEYIKLNVFKEFKDDKEYLEFEDLVLYYIQKRSTHYTVRNIKRNKVHKYRNKSDAMKYHRFSSYTFYKYLDSDEVLNGTYKITSFNNIYMRKKGEKNDKRGSNR